VSNIDHDRYVSELRRRIRKTYRSPDSRGPDKISPGEELRGIIKRERRAIQATPKDIELWLIFFDEAIGFWFAVWSNYKDRIAEAPKELSICLMALSGRVFQDLVCIREMIMGGFSVQANVVARTLIESIDVMHLLNSKPELACTFKEIGRNDEASKFWHQHCSRGKIHRIVKSRWLWFFEENAEAATAFHAQREGYLDLTGMSAHPTFAASLTTFMDSNDRDAKSIFDIALGSISQMSKFTIHLIILRIFEYGILWSGPKIGIYKSIGEPNVDSFLHHVISKGLGVVASIVRTVDGNGRDRDEMFYPEFKTYWPNPNPSS
jgi:hypothetical protein